jgi:AcrR family transcriptional regulator
VAQIEGHWCLSIISNEAAGQRLKTVDSARTILLHPELIRLGLLEYVEAARSPKGDGGWLFPAVATDKAANTYSAWVGRWLDRLGLGGGRRALHSLRHCFKDALRAGGVDEGLSDALTGVATMALLSSYIRRAQRRGPRWASSAARVRVLAQHQLAHGLGFPRCVCLRGDAVLLPIRSCSRMPSQQRRPLPDRHRDPSLDHCTGHLREPTALVQVAVRPLCPQERDSCAAETSISTTIWPSIFILMRSACPAC